MLCILRLGLTINHHMRAHLPNPLRRSLRKNRQLVLPDVVDGEGVLVGGVERDLALAVALAEFQFVEGAGGEDVFDRLEELYEGGLRGVAVCGHVEVEHCLELFLPGLLQLG